MKYFGLNDKCLREKSSQKFFPLVLPTQVVEIQKMSGMFLPYTHSLGEIRGITLANYKCITIKFVAKI